MATCVSCCAATLRDMSCHGPWRSRLLRKNKNNNDNNLSSVSDTERARGQIHPDDRPGSHGKKRPGAADARGSEGQSGRAEAAALWKHS